MTLLDRATQTDMCSPTLEPEPETPKPPPRQETVKADLAIKPPNADALPPGWGWVTLPILDALALAKKNGLEITDNYDTRQSPWRANWRIKE